MDPEVIDLFPSTVLKFKHEDQEIFSELEECVKAIEKDEQVTLHMGVSIPNDQSWLHFFGNYQLPKLNQFISDGVDTYVGNNEWELWSSWLNLYPKGANQDKHLHAGYDLSACYYHCTSAQQGVINFHSPLREAQLDCYATYQQMAVPTESGTLIIFPSWLEHSTTPNESDFFKISIGMNIKVNRSGERPFLGQAYGKHTLIHKYNGI